MNKYWNGEPLPGAFDALLRQLAVSEAEAIKRELKVPLPVYFVECKSQEELPGEIPEITSTYIKTIWDIQNLICRAAAGKISDGVGGATLALQLLAGLIDNIFVD